MTTISQQTTPGMTFFHGSDEKLLDLTGRQFAMAAPREEQDKDQTSPRAQSSPLKRALSPAPSSALSSIQDYSSNNDAEPSNNTSTANTQSARPAKRRKLTPAEKIEQQRVKDENARVRAEQKAARDETARLKAEQKAVKEEEKRVKDEEKRKVAEEKEAKKREKELEVERKRQEKLRAEQEKEEQKAKKERAQTRLTFFTKPSIEKADGEVEVAPTGVLTRRRSLSLETYDQMQKDVSASPVKKEEMESPIKAPSRNSDYHKHFLPFAMKAGVSVYQKPQLECQELRDAQAQFDRLTTIPASSSEYDLGLRDTQSSLEQHFSKSQIRGRTLRPVRQLIDHVPAQSANTIDLTGENVFSGVPVKYLHFHEDIRPAYFGTYTKIQDKSLIRKTRRKPHARIRTDTDYDYDSEAEWEADPEGEDLGDEDSEADTEEDGSEMGGFIDDEEDGLKDRPRVLQGGKVPTSSGMCWADQHGRSQLDLSSNAADDCLHGLRLQFLIQDLAVTSIDPFSTSYWQKSTPSKKESSKVDTTTRPPLKERDSNTFAIDPTNGFLVPQKPASTAKKNTKQGTQKSMSKQELEQYRSVVVGSTLGKNELVSLLKEKFSNFTMALIKDTLGEKFAQIGKSKADKKWIFVGAQE